MVALGNSIPVNKLEIPSGFMLGGRVWSVECVDNLVNNYNADGAMRESQCKIKLQGNNNAWPQNDDHIEHVFFHEIIHSILFAMGEKDLGGDEKFVDSFASNLHQIFKTAIYEGD